MYISEELKKELDYFRRMNEHFSIDAGKGTSKVAVADEKVVFMAFGASLAMDKTEDGFFDEFKITDTSISKRPEMQLDAYAFVESENSNEKHLHLFQFKLHEKPNHSASPIDLMNFVTRMNTIFVHPSLIDFEDKMDEVVREIQQKIDAFLTKRGRRIIVNCHYITNASGVTSSNRKEIEGVLGRFEYDKQHYNFNAQVYGASELLDLAVEGKIKVGKEVLEFIVDGEHAYRHEDNSSKVSIGLPRGVFIGMCNVNEFIRLQNQYHHNQLYSENIRLYLGDRSSVNKDIINTITSVESIWFPYMNNGISIICDKFRLGTPTSKGTISLELENMQIINGCQTVNALYSAKYNESTADDFRPSNILVRVYQIDPSQSDFKLNVIKATNNQNAVKTYSLLANDPIQIKIQETLRKLGFVYDRKGEGRQDASEKIISMPNSALAYRAVYEFDAQALRSRIGQSRVFHKSEYEKLYKESALQNDEELYELSVKLLTATIILDETRDLINANAASYLSVLPIFKKSAYYFAGCVYATNKVYYNARIQEMVALLIENNMQKIKHVNTAKAIRSFVVEHFDIVVQKFVDFYNRLTLDKTDIDNVLKSAAFGDEYKRYVNEIIAEV